MLLSCSCEGSVLDSQCALSTVPAGTITCLAFQASGGTVDADRELSFDEAQPQRGDWVRAAETGLGLRDASQEYAGLWGRDGCWWGAVGRL